MPNYGHLSLSCAKIERLSPLKKPSCKVRLFAQNRSRKYRQKVTATTLFQTAFHPDFQLLAQTPHVCFHGRNRVHTRLSEKDRTQRLTRRNRGLPDGAAITTLDTYCTFTNIPGPGIRTANFAAFGPWPGRSRRTQKAFGTAMRSCASLFRGVAAPLGCVICLQLGDVAVFSLCAQYFLNVRGGGGYHYPRCALRAVETPDGRLQKRLICRFLRSGGHY